MWQGGRRGKSSPLSFSGFGMGSLWRHRASRGSRGTRGSFWGSRAGGVSCKPHGLASEVGFLGNIPSSNREGGKPTRKSAGERGGV